MADSTASTMKAIQFNRTGGTEVLSVEQISIPSPGPTEVLVKNEYAGVNYIDTYFRSGLYPSPTFPRGLGSEGAGTVASIGTDVTHVAVGDRVAYLSMNAYAEYTCANGKSVAKLPEGLSFEIGAASILQGLTALTFVREGYEVKKGDHILVHAAAGGMGLLFVQLIKAIGGIVIATASTQEKLDIAKAHGADFLINYSNGEEDWVKQVLDIVPEGVEGLFDGVGKTTFEGGLKILKRKGTFVSYGNSSGAVPPFAISRLSAKNLRILRPTLFGYISNQEEFQSYTTGLFDFILKDDLKINIHKTYSLEQLAAAHNDLEGRGTSGKLLIKI